MNKDWEARLIYLSPGSRRRIRVVGGKLAELLAWKRPVTPVYGVKMQPLAPKRSITGRTIPLVTALRTAPVTVPYRVFRVIRNPAASTLARGRRLTRAALKVVKSEPER